MSNRVLLRTATPSPSGRRVIRWGIGIVFLLFALFFFVSGSLLVSDRGEVRTVWGVVLDGQSLHTFRSDAALQMLKEGRIDSVAISGTPIFKRRFSSQFLAEDLKQQGGDLSRIVEVRHFSSSTWQEAAALIPFFRDRGVDTVLLITSAYHTARAERIFNALSGGNPVFVTVDIGDPTFRPWGWWGDREAAAMWYLEWSKTAVTAAELLFKKRELNDAGIEILRHTAEEERGEPESEPPSTGEEGKKEEPENAVPQESLEEAVARQLAGDSVI